MTCLIDRATRPGYRSPDTADLDAVTIPLCLQDLLIGCVEQPFEFIEWFGSMYL